MSWKSEVDGIEMRRRRALEMGGAQAVQRQHGLGRQAVRERIDALVDSGSLWEMGPIAGHSETDAQGEVDFTPANYVLGLATIDGRRVVVGGEDFTQRGGSPSPAGLRKSVYAEQLALRYRVPLVRLLEGAGGSVPRPAGGERPAPRLPDPVYSPHRFESIMQAMGVVPVASAALGPVAGFPAARLAASHFSVMTRRTAQVLVAGPAVVERALGKRLSKEELGGAHVHERSGVVDCVVDDEASALAAVRRFLGYLPSSVFERAPREASADPPDRREEALLSIVPRDRRRAYKMRRIIRAVVDRESFFELAPRFGRSQIVGLARLSGQPVGVIANDPYYYAGAMTADGAQKVRRFVDLCDTFHLPIVALVDEPGFMIGPDAESAATIRHGTAALFSVMQSTVPWASVVVRKVYGVAGGAHFGRDATVLSWPSAEVGALPLEGGVAVAFRREIAAAPDPEAKRRELEDLVAQAMGDNPYVRAEAFGIHDLIDPRTTRPALCRWVEWIQPELARRSGPRSYTVRP